MAYTQTSQTERQLYQQLWLKAHAEGSVTIPLPNKGAATRVRFALYNAVRPVKDRKERNPALLEAAGEVSVSMQRVGDGPAYHVILQSKRANPDLAAVAGVLGVKIEDVPGGYVPPDGAGRVPVQPLLPPQVEQESLQRLRGKLEAHDADRPVRPKNPYFER